MQAIQPHTHSLTQALTDQQLSDTFERRFIFGVSDHDPPEYSPPIALRQSIATISAATNLVLMRRRHHNANNPALPLQHDTAKTIARVLRVICETATATRTIAEREETRIYTHYEGWLPDEDDLPTNEWLAAWSGLVRSTQPSVTLLSPPPTDAHGDPPYDLADPNVITRQTERSNSAPRAPDPHPQQCY